jgi:curved DNA-binding protein CbpA
MVEPGPDLYQVLGVAREATGAEITRAYRRRARAVHPDTAPPGAGSAARFRAVSEAYQVLSDPARRAAYDHASYRETAPGHSQAAPRRARPRPAPAEMPPAWPRVPAGPGPLRMPALWAGPVRVEPLRATAAGPGPGTGSQAGAAVRGSRYGGARRNGLR